MLQKPANLLGVGVALLLSAENAISLDLSNLRRFDDVTNSSDDYDIARFSAFYFAMQQKLGMGMELTVEELEMFYNFRERILTGKFPKNLIYGGINASRETMSGIPPFGGTSREETLILSAGTMFPLGDRSLGFKYDYSTDGRHGVVLTFRF